jgi:acid phosphatase family membrane protein YuiD
MYNYVLTCTVAAWTVGQIVKTILYFFSKKVFNVERLFGAGGMPSTHSAFVVAGLTAIYRECGFDSIEFAIMFTISAVVIYDALGVRHAAGQHAKAINKINRYFAGLPTDETDNITHEDIKELKEFLGHTPSEVLAGIVLGVLVAFVVPMY